MTKLSRIMGRAWEIARGAQNRFGGRVSEYFAEALRMSWAENRQPAARPVADRIDELTALGFNRWQKAGMDRMYINAGALGLSCTYYKTGNISSATFRGLDISNSEARSLKASKTYIDLKNGMIVSDSERLADAVADLIGLEHSYGYRQYKIA